MLKKMEESVFEGLSFLNTTLVLHFFPSRLEFFTLQREIISLQKYGY